MMKLKMPVIVVWLVTATLIGATILTGCTPRPVTTTATITTTATETLPSETITTTINAIVTVATTLTPQPTVPNQIAQDLTVTEAYNMIQDNIDNPQFVILDVRGPDEHATSHIEGSALIDMGSDSWLATVEVLDKSYTYLIY